MKSSSFEKISTDTIGYKYLYNSKDGYIKIDGKTIKKTEYNIIFENE